MVYKFKLFCFTLLTLSLLVACGASKKTVPETPVVPDPVTEPGQEPETPEPEAPTLPEALAAGILKLEFSHEAVGKSMAVTMADGTGLTVASKSFTQFQTSEAHYLNLKLELLCGACETNLALVAAVAPNAVASTAFADFNLEASVAQKVARALLPVHGMGVKGTGLEVLAEEASFQVFSESRLAAWQTLAPKDYRLLPYGFTVAKASDANASLGYVTASFKLPLSASESVPEFSIYLMPAALSQAQVTESLEEQGSMQAAERAALAKASLMVLGNSPSQASERFCRVKLSLESATTYLINEPNCRPIDTVDSFTDEQDGNVSKGNLSLREALARAHDGSLIKFSEASPILLDASLGSLKLNASVSIDASEHPQALVLNAQSEMPIFSLASGINASLNNLHFQNGKSKDTGGAFSIPEGTTVLVSNSSFTSNNAEADGGAIFNNGTLELSKSSFAQNFSSEDGGAVANLATLKVEQTYFFTNVAMGAGGAVFNASTELNSILNSQLSSNQADYGGAIFNRYGNLELRFNSIYANRAIREGGGLYINALDSQLALHGNLIAHNRDAAQELMQDVWVNGDDNPFSSSYNFVGMVDNKGFLTPTETTNLHNQVGLSLSTYLNPEVTWSEESSQANPVEPQASSLLVNAIPLATLGCGESVQMDIIGSQRPAAGACDIGAYELKQ